MKITISSKRKELFWSLVPSFVSLSDLRFSSAVCMVGGQLQWGNHLRRAAHDIFFVIESFVFEHSSKTTDSRSSEFFDFEPEISHYSEWWKRQVISGRRGWGAGYESYINAKVFEFHRSRVSLWFIILELCRGQGTRFNLGVGFRCVWVWLWGFFSLYEYQLSKFQFKFNLSSGNKESPVDAHMLNNTFP